MRFSGDDKLSGFDRKMWSLCYSTLERFGCLTMFKVDGPDARVRLDRSITFFVPGTHAKAHEVKAYLENELRHEASIGGARDDYWMWSTHVRVDFFSGIDGYMTHEETEPLVEAAIENLMDKLRKPAAQ